ncbi:DNA adenine methyltransferase YhdJ [Limihaloglobus sulfuriphilus]|uniref:Methyltransferase n=1 Tax=Limihaloglobus sulfuriphilus TaxID=1851148 RepID=A0A1Q2MFT7_9BACT|nr:site-specific DNA-methyltransferase [Limihaloglobus sulfuriphilus]AQQ71565.1 DNA adenine methyltransferase YhdJ [Limihaloglobus sulfuriphilus]
MSDKIDTVVCGDCLEVLGGIDSFCDLIFADPPFNIGYQYDQYHDKVRPEEYVDWCRRWMSLCCDVLKESGSFYIAIGDDYAAELCVLGKELGLTLRNWVVWHYTFGQQTKAKYARSHTHIFYFVKNAKEFKFYDHAVRVPSERQLIYADKRANPKGKMPDDTWNEYPRLCGTFKERIGFHPCQMPETVLARIIAGSSKKGDMVMDPFSGSGTTLVTAMKMGRHYFGTELSEDYVEGINQRIQSAKDDMHSDRNLFYKFSYTDKFETARLCADMAVTPEEVVKDEKLLYYFTVLMNVRTQREPVFTEEEICSILGVLGK